MAKPELHVEQDWAAAFARAGLDSLASVLERAACIRDLPGRANLELEVDGRLVYVKRRKRGTVCREWLFAGWARDHGLPTAEPVFTGVDRKLGAASGFADLAPARPLDDLLGEDALGWTTRRVVLLSLSAQVARLHGLRRHHRDLYLNHVFVDPAAEEPLVAIIDWERAGRHLGRLGRWVVKDLASLEASLPPTTVTRGERMRFLAHYLRALPGADAGRDLLGLARRVERKAARIRAHVPRTPVGEAARPQGGAP